MLTPQTRARFLRFFIVGGIGFVVQLVSVRLLKEVLPPRIAFTMAFLCSVSTHYLLNRFWALTSARTDTRRQFMEYLGTVGLSYLVSYSSFNLFLYVAKFGVMWSTVLSVPPSTLIVFLLLNYRVFRSSPSR
jgi:putative flippase GtrA